VYDGASLSILRYSLLRSPCCNAFAKRCQRKTFLNSCQKGAESCTHSPFSIFLCFLVFEFSGGMMRGVLSVIFILVSMVLSSCVKIPHLLSDTPVDVSVSAPCPPAQPSVAPFNSEQKPLSLEDLFEIARRNNPSLAAGAWDVQTAIALRNSAAAERSPNLRATGSYLTYLQNQRLVPVRKNNDPGMFSTSIFAGDIILKLPLFTGGRIRSEISAADLLSRAATDRLARTWEELVFNISSAFYTILGQRPVIESLEFSIKALQRQGQRVVDMMRVGKAAKVDVLRTEVRISDVEQRLIREKTILEIQHRLLANFIGVGGDAPRVRIQGRLGQNGNVPDVNGALAMAYAERGDYRAAKAALDAQAMKVTAARSARWPKISLEGTYGTRAASGITDNAAAYINRLESTTTNPPTLYNASPGVSPSLAVGNIGVTTEVPIIDGGKISAQIAEQETKLVSAQQNLRKLELQIRLDVETALLNVSSAQQRVQATRKAIEQAKESFRIETERYDLGKGSITDVLDAQSAMLEAETNYYRMLTEYNVAFAQLGLATGEKR
jgi:outer membrane protein